MPSDYSLLKSNSLAIVGSLSKVSKMPGASWSISPKHCITGQKLCKVKGSVCSTCYCRRGNYLFDCVINSHEKRLALFNESMALDGGVSWTNAMVFLIKNGTDKYFRWFDSGDLQSVSMLNCIVNVVKACKGIKFWLPTREYGIVGEWVRKNGELPSNLNIRLSAYMHDTHPPVELAASFGCTASGTSSVKGTCQAQNSGRGNCGTCRKCWSRSVPMVTYRKH